MDIDEYFRRCDILKTRYKNELKLLQKDFISSYYQFKVGDIVRCKRVLEKPRIMVVDEITLHDAFEEVPLAYIKGHLVDEDGYNLYNQSNFGDPSLSHLFPCTFSDEEIVEITKIKPRNCFR